MCLVSSGSWLEVTRTLQNHSFKFKYVSAQFQSLQSVATWQPSCQKVFEESGSGRKFLDLSSALSQKQAIW